MDYQIIETDAELGALIDRFADSDAVIVDTEFMRRDTFYPQAALFQFCFPGAEDTAWLIDPLKIEDFSPLCRLFSNPETIKVLHSPSEDLELFQNFLGCQPEPLFDTQRAAAFVGLRFGLGYRALVEAFSGVEIDKDATRSDWLARPLSPAQLEYAAADVVPLLPIYRELYGQLQQQGRLDWVLEDGRAATRAAAEAGEPSYLKVKSAWKLSRRQLGVLAVLCEWRDDRARRLDKPRSWILADKVCLELALRAPSSIGQLRSVPDLPPAVVRKQGETLVELIDQAMGVAEEELPGVMPKPLNPEQRNQLKRVKRAAADIARGWEIEPEILFPAKDYELMVRLANAEAVERPQRWQGWRDEPLVRPLLAELGVGG